MRKAGEERGGEAKGKRAQNPICRLRPGNRYARDHVKTTSLKSDGRPPLGGKIRVDGRGRREGDRRSAGPFIPRAIPRRSSVKISPRGRGNGTPRKNGGWEGQREERKTPADRAGRGGCSVGTPPPGHRHGDGQRCIGVY